MDQLSTVCELGSTVGPKSFYEIMQCNDFFDIFTIQRRSCHGENRIVHNRARRGRYAVAPSFTLSFVHSKPCTFLMCFVLQQLAQAIACLRSTLSFGSAATFTGGCVPDRRRVRHMRIALIEAGVPIA